MNDQTRSTASEDNVVEFPERADGDAATERLFDEASHWVVKFEADAEPSQADIDALHAWMATSPQHREVLLSMASSWNDMDLLSRLMVAPAHNQVNTQAKSRVPSVFNALEVLQRFLKPAIASVMVLFVVGMLFWQPNAGLMEARYITTVGEQAKYQLNDNSVLRLNTNSQVDVRYSEQRRRLTLRRGEVHFDVAPDKQRPFEVYAGNRLVRAVGTAFSVRLEPDRVKVVVNEGVVDLAVVTLAQAAPAVSTELAPELATELARESQQSITQTDLNSLDTVHDLDKSSTEVFGSLKAGQSIEIPVDIKDVMNQVEYHDPQSLNRSLAWIEGKLVFDGESLEQVVSEVSRYTPVLIEVADPALKQLRIGGQFQIGETEALFDVLQSGFGVSISRISDTHVRIHAPL